MKTDGDMKFNDVFYEPVHEAMPECDSTRKCFAVSDLQFVLSGIGRCLEPVISGRDWVQKLKYHFSVPTSVSNFFSILKSARRLRLLNEVAEWVVAKIDQTTPVEADPFAAHSELDGFAVYAADGHYHRASAHETLIKGKRYAVGHVYAMNLRTLSMRHLDITRPLEQNKKKEHELNLLKRLEGKALRMGEPQGRKVILAYDPAIIDIRQWDRWKRSKGLYIITREKSNMKPMHCSELDFDRNDSRNNGVVSDEKVGYVGIMIRRITYIDPVSGKQYVFITNEMTLPPGLLTFIYKRRWDIEKVYDEFKNHLMETKAWADSSTAKCQQAAFLCITHNLLILLERKLEKEEGIREVKIERKREKRLDADIARIKEAGRKPNSLAQAYCRCVKRTLQFIREVRLVLTYKASWRQAVDSLRPVMQQYLS